MTIKTNFDLNDIVYLLKNEKIHAVEIVKINVQLGNSIERVDTTNYRSDTPIQYVSYRVRYESGGEENFPENRLFATKKDLINSL